MKVLFSNPPWWDVSEQYLRCGVRAGSRWPFTMAANSMPGEFKFGGYLPYPFFLGYAATYAAANTTAEIRFRDSIALRETYQTYADYLAVGKFDIVVIETATPSWQHDAQVVQMIHNVLPAAKIVIAGPITTTKSDEILATLPVHACLRGEYEKNAVKVIEGASGVIDFDLLTLAEMNAAPPPYMDAEIAHRYFDYNPIGQQYPHAHVWSSRGCPYKCLAGDTLVNTVEGMVPIRDLVGRTDVGVFTYDREAKRAKISTPRVIAKTGENQKLVRVHFDDGSHIDCTPDHRFVVWNYGENSQLIEASHLSSEMQCVRVSGKVYVRTLAVEELPGLHDTYCMEVPDTGVFYANDVLVKNCCFCVWPAAMTGNDPDGTNVRKVRHYSPEYMEPYLTGLVRDYGYQSIYFDDDTFNLGNSHVVKMCEVMRRVGVPWSAMCRADTSKMETWSLMKESGCFGVKLGFESGNQYVVDKIVNKHLDLEYAREVVHELKRIGMTVHGTFTVGLPGETREQMQDTVRFIESLPLDSHQLSGTAEIEGTPLHTLRTAGHLDAYEGASLPADAEMHTDGNKRFAMLAEELRNS